MISFNLKSSLAIALICFVCGFVLAMMLINGCNHPVPQGYVKRDVLQKQADSVRSVYQTKLSLLQSSNAKLVRELDSVRSKLANQKLKTKGKAEAIKKMVTPKGYPAKELLRKNDTSYSGENNPTPCDSLAEAVTSYLEETELKDSLYESEVAIQDSIISGKDSIIEMQTTQFNKLSLVFDNALKQSKLLESENRSLQKKLRRQKLKGKFQVVIAAVLSGFATHNLTR
jgi:hypothetical protein